MSYPDVSTTRRAHLARRWTQGRVPWPDGARCVVVVTIDFDGPSHDVGQGFAPLGSRSTGRYSARRGVPRHLDMLDRLGIPATFFVPGYDAECYPETIREISRRGHEVGAHGYLHERTLMPPDEERRRLTLTHGILADLTGTAPVGWRSPSGQKTYNTLNVLSDLGYEYDCSDKDFDLPYRLRFATGGTMTEIPNNTVSLDDHPWYSASMTPTSEVVTCWEEEFDAIYEDRGFFLLSIHPRSGWGSGTPSRTAAVAHLLQRARDRGGVRFMTCKAVARWMRDRADAFEEVRP